MGLLLLGILLAPLPLMIAMTSWGILSPPRPIRVTRQMRYDLPERQRRLWH